MNFAIDIDDTLSAHPVTLTRLIEMIAIDGFSHTVVLLTGGIVENVNDCGFKINLKQRVEQVEALMGYTGLLGCDVVSCMGVTVTEVGMLKARYCKEHNIDVFIDDSQLYCSIVLQGSPKTMVLQVVK